VRSQAFAIALLALTLAAGAACTQCGGGTSSDGADAASSAILLVPLFEGFDEPLGIEHAGDGRGRLFIVERGGTVRVIEDEEVAPEPFLDISSLVTTGGTEQGLLGLAFPPAFETAGHFYVYYSRAGDGATVLSRFRLSSDGTRADPASEEVLLTVPQPYSNHNGGRIAFGPDGYLYVGLGDGGSGGDPQGNAQNPATLLGSLLRLDVESGESPYAIPPDNPFARRADALPEVWAYGLRNPWRFSFDPGTGDLHIADVGQNNYEEIDLLQAPLEGGANFGWNILEGTHCYATDPCDPTGTTLPVAEYTHDDGNCSVTGGYVYRGETHTSLKGMYFYADFCSGLIWGITRANPSPRVLADTDMFVSAFGTDESGELYLVDYRGGVIYRIGAASR
jgi:glucose/arabinose dehydrogenase